MQTKVLNYRIIIFPDKQTGTNKLSYTALFPTLGVADDGKTIDEALINVKGAIEIYIESLVEDNKLVPVDNPEHDIITTTQINVPFSALQFV